ncbi:hypothetical protein ACQPWY_21130 [Pseudonocardia xinjiangensis]|uniref:hypothetical protein n=1 Tax=Pseudonocardia xinjiangensis TaxID=75289 RepID=UPI003D906599
MYESWSSTTSQPPRPLDRPVWVDLEVFYGPPDHPTAGPEDDPPPGRLLVPTGRVPGVLARWERAVDGRWFGIVRFAVCDSYGAIVAEHRDALVPASALSLRETEPYR